MTVHTCGQLEILVVAGQYINAAHEGAVISNELATRLDSMSDTVAVAGLPLSPRMK
jgi:hypothetical protein